MRAPLTLCMLLLAGAVSAASWAGGAREEAERFYFTGPHLFPFTRGIGGLIPHDMNGDGRADLLALDSRASKFHILRQKDADEEPEEQGAEWDEEDVNELEPDRLLAEDEIRLNQLVLAHEVGGFAGAQEAIVYLTGDMELLVDRRGENGRWETAQRFLLDLESKFVGGFERADLDGNGRDDLVLLAQDAVLVFYQDEQGRLAEPQSHPVALDKSSSLVVGDVDNDGRPDLLYRSPGTRYPLRIRLTLPDGTPGPEYRFRMPPPRHVAVGDCTGDGANEIVLIESTTNRLKVLRWTLRPHEAAAGAQTGDLELVAFARDQKSRTRSFAIADVDGDGLSDVVVSDPSSARLSLMRAREGTGLTPAESFPSLEEPSSLAALAPRHGPADLFVCSRKEGIVGLTRYEPASGRLAYPRPVKVGGEPHSMAVGHGPGGTGPFLYCAVRGAPAEGDEKGPVEIVTLERRPDGYEAKRRQPLEGLKEPPAQLVAVDADGDGASDLLAFPQYAAPALLIQGRHGEFRNASDEPGFYKHMLRDLKPAAIDTAPLRAGQSPAMFLGNRNLVRALRYDGSNLLVEDQFSGTNPRSAYVALTTVDLDGDGEVEILAADHAAKWLSVLKRDAKGVYAVARHIDIGPFEILGLATADTDGDGAPEVLIVGQEKLGTLFLQQGAPELKEVAAYETDQEDTAYAEVLIVDLNRDGKNDLLLREVQKHQIEVLSRGADGAWKLAMRFKVFEGRIFERADSPAPEPRELVTAELTGDGLTDIAIVVHDRVILYPQQAQGQPEDDG